MIWTAPCRSAHEQRSSAGSNEAAWMLRHASTVTQQVLVLNRYPSPLAHAGLRDAVPSCGNSTQVSPLGVSTCSSTHYCTTSTSTLVWATSCVKTGLPFSTPVPQHSKLRRNCTSIIRNNVCHHASTTSIARACAVHAIDGTAQSGAPQQGNGTMV